ncbi:MAG: TetR/AcrR family transcriptional regulator [Burkholderiaceae bacterium]|jgi:AcrR family transcriptional regulator|nr:TetR/AcrR family transcriptional regulator [Burkholderiaceae bacterium]
MPIGSALSSLATALRPRKGDQTRAAIVEAALATASRDGLEGLTIGTLADQMQMSKSGVFAHFGSREELQLAVLKEYTRRFVDEVLRPAVRKPRGLPRLETILDRWVAFLARELTRGCIMIAGAVEYDDRPGPQRDEMVAIITGWKAELLKAIRQAVAEGHLARGVDAQQMVFEIYGLMLAMHQDARLLRSADSAKRARAGLRRLIDDARAARPRSTSVSTRRPAKTAAARVTK